MQIENPESKVAQGRAGLSWQARLAGGISQGLTSASAALLAYLPARALGLQEGFWGAITAIAVVQTEFGASQSSGRDQFAGAAVGGLIGAGVVSWTGQSLAGYALAVIVSMATCWLLNISTAARLAGITSTIIALVPHHGSIERMMLGRSRVGRADSAWCGLDGEPGNYSRTQFARGLT